MRFQGLAAFGAWLIAICVAGGLSSGQAYTPPSPPLTTLPPCTAADSKPAKKKKQQNCDATVYPPSADAAKAKKSAAVQSGSPAQAPPQTPVPPAAQQFPFPGDPAAGSGGDLPSAKSQPAANAFPYPGEGTAEKSSDSEVPHDPAAEKKAADTPAGKAYPFPGGGTADMPADADSAPDGNPPATPDSSGSSSSSSSSSDSTSAPGGSEAGCQAGSKGESDGRPASGPKGEYDDDDSGTANSKRAAGRGNKVVKPQTDEERVDEDLSVAKFYTQSGNFMGAYFRAKDAVKTKPEDAETHFILGEAARRLGKKEEAVAEYNACLKLAPDGERAEASARTLEKLR